ncbi:polysaccharide pyruvyl transferase family protein [Halalkaliarchaeum sp. AArc-GB]|uniref:polysaccharide pyruvyl transferase family protein n=1 Tax=Halalkaliarchaeum sp. AArc-GB TaxID=3074078 RepID=UPI002855CE3F|nr:polysaccharide pyruvyl transferase family protein [Halalkaliarchaeum sp. AArc-GB]MDR5674237.1 polysaccharide pyruvyl transferase family protein [Halalkaliarchaeum sp. AArc-GB]
MKIGILTLHNNRNKGSLLQNYCLLKSVEDLFPEATVETLDYRCLSHEFKRYKNSLVTKQLDAIPARIRDFRLSTEFLSKNCNLTSAKLISDRYGKAVSFVNEQNYDLLIFGSDTIWKVTGDYNRRFSGERPFPNVYFGGTQISAEKVAYAASANKTDVDRFTGSERHFVTESLTDFFAIGVRDAHTEDVLRDLDVLDFERVPDPTFIYDIAQDCNDNKEYRSALASEKPILGVNTPRNPLISELVGRFRRKGYLIVSPNASPYTDVDFVGEVSPFEYYQLHGEFDFMITDSLHSTIFCLQHRTPFITIDLDEKYGNVYSKTKSLLDEFELLNRHVDGFAIDSREFDVERYTEISTSESEKIGEILQRHRQVGRDFLDRTLTAVRTDVND